MGNNKIQSTKLKISIFLFIVFILILIFSFRSLIFGVSTNLIDWRDYAYLTWITNLNIGHLKNLDFGNIFNTNTFYPHKNTLFLSDTILTQSFIGLPFSYFTKNPVLIFNIVFLTTFMFNYLSSYLFWRGLFFRNSIAFVGSILTVFSPFFYIQSGHFQMLSFWPFFMSLYFLINRDNTYTYKKCLLVGFFLAVQFLASVYLAFFLIFTIVIFLLIELITTRKLKNILIKFLIIFMVFIVLDSIFIKGYLDAKKQFGIKRDYGEFVTYSAHLSDYIFPQQKGLIYQNSAIQKWLSYNRHTIGEVASFPGIVLTLCAIIGFFTFYNSKEKFFIFFNKPNLSCFFLLVTLIGFLFSLGPRISFNGIYGEIPLPYTFLLKLVPLFETIRATSRWSFLFYFGLTYFALNYITRLNKFLPIACITTLLFLEQIPTNFPATEEKYITNNDARLTSLCANKKTVVIEIPVTHFDSCCSLVEGLSYITKRELASFVNGCYLVNGYSGYDLPSIQNTKNNIINSINSGDSKSFINTIKSSNSKILVINTEHLTPEIDIGLQEMIPFLIKEDKITPLDKNIYSIK